MGNASPVNANSVSTASWKNGKNNIDESKTIDALRLNIDLLTKMNEKISNLSANFNRLEKIKERAFGGKKINLLKEEIELMDKQQDAIVTNIANMEALKLRNKSYLTSKGFRFDDDGQLSNYNSKLMEMEKRVESLQKKSEANSKSESLKKSYESANKELETVKASLGQFLQLQTDIPNAKGDWEDLETSIADARAEIIRANREMNTFYMTERMAITGEQFDRDDTYIQTLQIKAELVGADQAKQFLEETIALMQRQQRQQNIMMDEGRDRAEQNKKVLDEFGFNFTKDGYVYSGAKTLNDLKYKLTPEEYDAVKEAYDEYIEDIYHTIPEAEQQWHELAQSIKETEMNIKRADLELKNFKATSQIEITEYEIGRNDTLLETLQIKAEVLGGTEAIKFLEEATYLLEKNQKAQETLLQSTKDRVKNNRAELEKYNFHFTADGGIHNGADDLRDLKGSLGKEEYEYVKEVFDQYMEDIYENIPEAEKEWWSLRQEIIENEKAIKEAKMQMEDLIRSAKIDEIEKQIDHLNEQLDILGAKLELSNGSEQLDYLNQSNALLQDMIDKLEQSASKYQNILNQDKKNLVEFGIKFNDDGSIKNLEQVMSGLANADLMEELQDYADKYNDSLSASADATKQMLEYQQQIKDNEKSKLETIKKVEDEITEIYKDQIDKRIEAIEKQADAQKEALSKAKEEYNKWRDEADYKNDYDEQLKVVEDLQKDIAEAQRDDSLTGKKKVQDLMEQLKEEQENLEKLLQDKVDSDINDMFDDQMDKVEEDAKKQTEGIEEVWTDSKISEMVQQALATGAFTDIDGKVTNLQTKLMEFTQTSSDYFGVMGNVLREELLGNLNLALDTMNKLDGIYNKLDISQTAMKYGETTSKKYDLSLSPSYLKEISKMVLDQMNYDQIASSIDTIQNSAKGNVNSIQIGDTTIEIKGSADSTTVKQVEQLLEQHKKELVNDILKNAK